MWVQKRSVETSENLTSINTFLNKIVTLDKTFESAGITPFMVLTHETMRTVEC